MINTNARYWRHFVIALMTFSAMLVCSQALAAPSKVESLKSLRVNNETINAAVTEEEMADLITVMMIYQPECSWCKKQGRLLAKAFELCQSSMTVALVGAKGSVRQLKKELKNYHQGIPAYQADRKFLRVIGGYQASPTTLIYDHQGNLITKKRGFIPAEKLTQAFSLLTQGQCQI